ncbi:UDP-glucuronosyltransferase 2C1-like isoform X3 [Ursus arctos]|uniref:UDP-glucuronosyltransferase 2C1-like isoform X3 n=1 Tax=Ursus arctos TaxID=9644 RepID=UPI000E6E0FF4|nr:UDP-glucuronosyltransferase 2C1-like isoform X3 [Ursus arctos]
MRTMKGFYVLFTLHLCFLDSGKTGKILVWPSDSSHWINLKVILDQLQRHGHEITILVPSPNHLFDLTKIPFNVENLQLPVTKETLKEELDTILYIASFEMPKLSWWDRRAKLREMGKRFFRVAKRICDSAITNKELLSRLQAAKFDICLADPLSFCGELLAELLNIPFIYSFRFSHGSVIERLCAQLPTPSSYVPGSTSGLTDSMTFVQRLENWLLYIMSDIMFLYFLFPEWDEYYSKILGKPTTLCEIMGKAEMWLIRTYWDFEFPYPYLPNFEFVGGLHCKPAKPLPKELEEFVQSSGKDGIVVFTLGSMIKNLTEEKSNIIASALAQIPQKVIPRPELLSLTVEPMGSMKLFTMESQCYKENAMTLSRIHHDQPMKPLDRAVFWIEFVMRHKGAKHLRPASHDLTWFQYHSLDVIGFLLACVATTILLVSKCCLFCCWKFGKTGKKNKRE